MRMSTSGSGRPTAPGRSGPVTGPMAAAIIDSARTLPWLARQRIILVLQAERLLAPPRESEASTRDLETLEQYLAAPQPHAALVLVAGTLDMRRRIVKLLLKCATVIECSGPGGGDPKAWIRNYVAEQGARIDAGAVRLLADRAGHDVVRLRGDLDRLFLYVAGERTITAVDVEEVAQEATLKDPWAIARAIESGSPGEALRELSLILASGDPPLKVLGQLAWVVRAGTLRGNFPSAQTRAAVEALFRTDLEMKMSAGDPRVLLERLIVELCGTGRASGRKAPTAPR